MSKVFLLLTVISSFWLASCGPVSKTRFFPKPTDQEMALEVGRLSDSHVAVPSPTPASKGSLWPSDDHVFFYRDRKALRVGDVLTVSIVENAQATNAADTDLSRKSSIKANLSSFFGGKRFFGLSKLGQDLLDSSAENAHSGSGTTSREGSLIANITVVVREVLPNGNLVLQGSRAVVVNHEEQFITLTGIVRPQDIRRDNVVLSTQLADANITFGGTGVVADKQRSGWGTWLFDWIWPF